MCIKLSLNIKKITTCRNIYIYIYVYGVLHGCETRAKKKGIGNISVCGAEDTCKKIMM